MTIKELNVEESEPSERERLFGETHKRSMERVARINDMMQAVVKAQVAVEGFLIEMLEAHGKDPAHYFFTSKKIKALRDIDTGVGRPIWDLLLQASYVRNELVHSLNEAKIKEESDITREAYLAITQNELQKQSIRDMTDSQMVTSAIYHCIGHILIATDMLVAEKKK
ncbi:hypothetical protein [Rhodopseudomonas palustris]|uniref:hypothetical protein n=1 Tax=Rhodopseudomonas palustris TaxID=1076 RepID=UPI000D19E19B|nr:hypothetical protein [Rhodopseudomonas palustris]AVT81429.1 hypothetical protein RPYSC3_25680 [Rhodopseudomonas palustris]